MCVPASLTISSLSETHSGLFCGSWEVEWLPGLCKVGLEQAHVASPVPIPEMVLHSTPEMILHSALIETPNPLSYKRPLNQGMVHQSLLTKSGPLPFCLVL